MGRPRFLSDNLFSWKANPAHLVTAESEASGWESFRVGSVRREELAGWTPDGDNKATYVRVDCGIPRAADCLILDRNMNLTGYPVVVRASNNNFGNWSTPVSETIPATPLSGARAGESPGALTWEGAWVRTFPLTVARYWDVYIPAMGAGLRPRIGGVYLGLSVQFANGPILPYSTSTRQLAYDEILSPSLWSARSRQATRFVSGSTPLVVPLVEGEIDLVEYHMGALYWSGRPMWIITNDERAERSLLVYAPAGEHGAMITGEDRWGVMVLDWREHQPLRG